MSVELKKKLNIVVKDENGNLVHMQPTTKSAYVEYEDGTVEEKLSEVDGALAAKADEEHSHGSITAAGRIGDTAGLPLITGAGGAIGVGSFGTAEGTFAEGNDPRLSDARTPVAHMHSAADISSLDGYQKALVASAVSPQDSLGTAIGKLEKGIEDASGYAAMNTVSASEDTVLQTADGGAVSVVAATGDTELGIPYFDSSETVNPTSFWIRNAGSGTVSAVPQEGVQIDGSSDPIELAPGESILLVPLADGSYSVASDGRWMSAADGKQNVISDLDEIRSNAAAGAGLADNVEAIETKLAGIETGAERNVISSISVNGETQSVSDGTVSIDVPVGAESAPLMDGTAAVGSSEKWAKEDHVHPSDTSKVDKVEGKGLSANDFTDTLLSKLNGVEAGAEANVIETVKVNGTSVPLSEKSIDISVPTAYASNPQMDGTASAGTSTQWAKGDHVHPSDTSKVDKVEGKGLSANDFTDALKSKLDAVESGAEVNVLEGVKVNGTAVSISDRIADISVPVGSSTAPLMDGTASAGTETEWSRADHVHPSDTSKVDKVAGKGLSTNDFTDALKSKLDAVESGSQANVIETLSVNGQALSPDGKNIDISVPVGSSTAPLMDGTASAGTSSQWAKGDHVHPSDTSKVDKIEGKELSSNDFTDALLSKLNGVEAGAEVNVIETVKVNSSALTVSDRAVNIEVPSAGTVQPAMDGTASAGMSGSWSRADHVHPSDTSKVDKVEGKGLSANDFTDALKSKLDGISDGANAYVLPNATSETLGGVTVGQNISVSSGTISVPNASTSAVGVSRLSSSVSLDSETLAATPKAVKTAYDLANSKQSPATTLAGYGITDAYTKSEIDSMLTSAMHYKGSVASMSNLPTLGVTVGDFYNVEDTGRNYAWTGSEWDLTGTMTEIDTITAADIDAIMADD